MTKNSVSHSENCTVCNHPWRNKIEESLRESATFKEIIDQYGSEMYPLSDKTLSRHWKEHLLPAVQVKSKALIVQGAVETKDSIIELTGLMDNAGKVLTKLFKEFLEMEPDDPKYYQHANAIRGLTQAYNASVKLNAALLGDTAESRKLDPAAVMKAVKALLQERARMETVTPREADYEVIDNGDTPRAS